MAKWAWALIGIAENHKTAPKKTVKSLSKTNINITIHHDVQRRLIIKSSYISVNNNSNNNKMKLFKLLTSILGSTKIYTM